MFSTASNTAFRDRIAGMDDPGEIAMLQFERLWQAGAISNTQYWDMLSGADQSREAYGRAIWNSDNTRTAYAIVRNININININSEYFARFSENPDAYWMGLGTIAPDLVGQGLIAARFMNKSINSKSFMQRLYVGATGLPAELRTAYAGLVEGNLRVAADMLPIYAVFNNLGGIRA